MKPASTLGIVLACLAAILFASCARASRPIVLVFETKQTDDASFLLAGSATKALRNYLRESQKVDATIFSRESPAVTRALLEKKFTADQISSYSTEAERVKVAEALGFNYACGGDVSVKEGRVTLRMWVTKAGGGKNDRWEATGAAASTGTGQTDVDNAMQSAASAAVRNIERRAFTELPQVTQPEASKGNESTAINSDQAPKQNKPTADDYTTDADKNLKAGNIALAIQQYSRAVDTDPTSPALRLKLADAYAARGMFDEAETSINRAERLGASADSLAATRDRLQKLRDGKDITESPKTPRSPNPTREPSEPVVMSSPDTSIAKIIAGDKLWNEGKPDEAADAYKESAKINPSEWRAWERLAIVQASMSLFGESRKALESLRKAQPEPTPETIENRYEMLRKAYDTSFDSVLSHYDTISKSFASGAVSRERYYGDVKGLSVRLESMAKFLDAIDVPPAKKSANFRRGLACGLMAQAASSLIEFLETNAKTAKDNAGVFAAQARKELDTARQIETTTAALTK